MRLAGDLPAASKGKLRYPLRPGQWPSTGPPAAAQENTTPPCGNRSWARIHTTHPRPRENMREPDTRDAWQPVQRLRGQHCASKSQLWQSQFFAPRKNEKTLGANPWLTGWHCPPPPGWRTPLGFRRIPCCTRPLLGQSSVITMAVLWRDVSLPRGCRGAMLHPFPSGLVAHVAAITVFGIFS